MSQETPESPETAEVLPPSPEDQLSLAEVDIKPRRALSMIWLLPFIAALIGAWLIYKGISEAGIEATIFFKSGEGIVPNKTQVVYRGLQVGIVKKVSITPDLQGVNATVELKPQAEALLRKTSKFWLVKPRISVAEISGLETLVSGNYIDVQQGEGKPQYHFNALENPPPVDPDTPGLHLTLQTKDLGSLERGSPVFFKKIQVGQVTDYTLSKDNKNVNVRIIISPKHQHLVQKNSRFWNASGVSVKGNLSGFKFRTGSLTSILSGGIAFFNPDTEKTIKPAKSGDLFTLFEDFDAADIGIRAKIHFSSGQFLTEGQTKVVFEGLTIGVVKRVKVNKDLKGVTATILFDPRAEPALIEGTQFWLVKPKISLAEVTGLDTLISGNYIAVRLGDLEQSKPQRVFTALAGPPPLPLHEPGLHLTLVSESLSSVEVGSPVYYKKIPVGSVQSYAFTENNKQVSINIFIKPEYADLVRTNSRFWNASGVSISGNLSGIKVHTESITSLLTGGIAFYTPPGRYRLAKNSDQFNLYNNYDDAHQTGIPISISFPSGEGLREGTPIKYEGVEVGKVTRLRLNAKEPGVIVKALITQGGYRLAQEDTQFWIVKAQLGLAKTQHLETLISGQYIQAKPATKKGKRQYVFKGLLNAPMIKATSAPGLKITLTAPRLGSIKEGVKVFYRDIPVGSVTGFELAPTANKVHIYLNIENRYRHLVRQHTRFWNTSGIGFDFSLFGGAKLKTDSLESIIEGGIAFATPNNHNMGGLVRPFTKFRLHAEPLDEWLQWAPKIPL